MEFKEEYLKKEFTDFAEDIIFWVCNKGTKMVDEIVDERINSILYGVDVTLKKK